ncbi:MAG: PhzF family phenazine biosynthesis protein [Phycisphaerae bacterium]|nr:PhzF family phenazine biosynthesis protein [Phycisphaerae bacterium]
MKNRTFYIVDVFAEHKYSGNQLAVVTQPDGLSAEQMLQITREMHFSETTFICSDRQADGGFDVRIYTPGEEVPFAGHPTLGTAYVLSEILQKETSGHIKLNLGVGQIPVTREGDLLWMTTHAPRFGRTYTIEDFAPVLSLDATDFDPNFPIQVVSTGLPFVIVPLANLHAVRRSRINPEALETLISDPKDTREILVCAPETYNPDCQLNVRVYVPLMGIPEDPATGSANSCLAGYLSEHKYFGSHTVSIQVEQGMEIHRPSCLHLKASKTDSDHLIQVGGQVQLIAKGTLL